MTKNAFFIMKRYIMNSQCDELPAGLIYVAQLVEHCTGIAEVKDSNPIQCCSGFHFTTA